MPKNDASPGDPIEVKHLERTDFDGLLNETFTFSVDGVKETVAGELIAVTRITSDTVNDREPFRLEFKMAPDANVGQALFKIEHRSMDPFQIFIVPVKGDAEGWYMDAIFN